MARLTGEIDDATLVQVRGWLEEGQPLNVTDARALLASYDMRRTQCEVFDAEKAMRTVSRHDAAAWDKRADKYLDEAAERTAQEVTADEHALLNRMALGDSTGAIALDKALFKKLVASYDMMRVEYESSHARCMLAFDERDEARHELKAVRQACGEKHDKLNAEVLESGRLRERLKEERDRSAQLRSMVPAMDTPPGIAEVPVDLKLVTPGEDVESLEAAQIVVLRYENWQRAVDLLVDSEHHADKEPYVRRALDLLTKVDDGRSPTEPSYDAPAG